MLHPFMTEELARQRRATLHAQSHNQRLAHQLQLKARTDWTSPREVDTGAMRPWSMVAG
jgi:hypothetical protein